jgi:hypothetical protein
MKRRILRVLLVCSIYDYFMLEHDGKIEEALQKEYQHLRLKNPPRLSHQHTLEGTLAALADEAFDMCIVMPDSNRELYNRIAAGIKEFSPALPITAISNAAAGTKMLRFPIGAYSDFNLAWLGNTSVLVAAVKLAEDYMNAPADTEKGGAGAILIVEDSVRFYTTCITIVYQTIYEHIGSFTLGAGAQAQGNFLRGRPKVMLAKNYEEAKAVLEKYKGCLLGIITDACFPAYGAEDTQAGYRLSSEARILRPDMPILMQSGDSAASGHASKMGLCFAQKSSLDFTRQLEQFLLNELNIGPLQFSCPGSASMAAAACTLNQLSECAAAAEPATIAHLQNRGDFVRWMRARALFPLADYVEELSCNSICSPDKFREILCTAIDAYIYSQTKGAIAINPPIGEFKANFISCGTGSMGGKARGLAFASKLCASLRLESKYPELNIYVPKALVLCSSFFEQFMESNNLYGPAFCASGQLTELFSKASLPADLEKAAGAFAALCSGPVAVRSSSLLEDSSRCSFAGVYLTKMVACPEGSQHNLDNILDAVKQVYASVYSQPSKQFFMASSQLIDQEKMSVVIQEVCGSWRKGYFYPAVSGFAQSRNYYPRQGEKPADGCFQLAAGMGSYLAGGGAAQMRSLGAGAGKGSQAELGQLFFNAVPPAYSNANPSGEIKLPISSLSADNYRGWGQSLNVSPPDIYSFLSPSGWAELSALKELLDEGEKAHQAPVEIEFAIEPEKQSGLSSLCIVQLRPMQSFYSGEKTVCAAAAGETAIIESSSSLGNGQAKAHSILVITEQAFKQIPHAAVIQEISSYNKKMLQAGRRYGLAGPGRWGSSDSRLGLAVRWQQVCGAAFIAEMGLSCTDFEPSYGSHFFHNMVNTGTIYLYAQQWASLGSWMRSNESQVQELLPGISTINASFICRADGDTRCAGIYAI